MELLLFTSAEGGPVYVNPSRVTMLAPEGEGRTRIVFGGPEHAVVVDQPVEDVAQEMFRGAEPDADPALGLLS